jgi:hypothetical protein
MVNSALWRERVTPFFTDPASADVLSAYRIGTACMGLLVVAIIAPSLLDIYGAEGFIQWVVSNELFRIASLPSLVQLSELLERIGVSPDAVVLGAFVVYVLSLTGMLVGWRTRLTTGIAWMFHFLIANTSIAFGYGVETFLHIGLFYCLVMPSAERWSLDARAGRTGHSRVSAGARIAQRVLQIHLCIVYLNSGIAKALGLEWWNGEAIWRALMQPDFRQYDLSWLASFPVITLLMGWGVLLVEFGYPIAMYHRRLRPYWLAAIIAVHVSIALFMGLWMFSLMMIITNLVGFASDSGTLDFTLRRNLAFARLLKPSVMPLTQAWRDQKRTAAARAPGGLVKKCVNARQAAAFWVDELAGSAVPSI